MEKEEGRNGYAVFAALSQTAETECSCVLLTWCRWPDSNGYAAKQQGILSPWCLPFHHTGMLVLLYHLASRNVKHRLCVKGAHHQSLSQSVEPLSQSLSQSQSLPLSQSSSSSQSQSESESESDES